MDYVIAAGCFFLYYAVGFAFYVAYWRYSDANPESGWDKFIGGCWLFAWPVVLLIAILSLPVSLIDSIPVKMTAKRLSDSSGYKPE